MGFLPESAESPADFRAEWTPPTFLAHGRRVGHNGRSDHGKAPPAVAGGAAGGTANEDPERRPAKGSPPL